jgi:hypothetical protein
MDNITFEQICEMEPGLHYLHRLASMIGRKRNQSFCANEIWYDIFKPRLKYLVGWHRLANPEVDFAEEIMKHTHCLNDIDITSTPPRPRIANTLTFTNPASQCKNEILWSSEAYDIAYNAIYKALPNCYRCGCY